LVQVLLQAGHAVDLVCSHAAYKVLALEDRITLAPQADPGAQCDALFADLDGLSPPHGKHLRLHPPDALEAPVASGSVRVAGAAVVPCSMATAGAIAAGAGRNLVHRVADVALKEGTPLVLAPRETPLSTLHLENLARLSRLGARIVACMPGYYHHPQTIRDLVDFVVGRVLEALGCRNDLVSAYAPHCTTEPGADAGADSNPAAKAPHGTTPHGTTPHGTTQGDR
jgi:4-hydroxy-3-polyprenylbenzoate decarboxylase